MFASLCLSIGKVKTGSLILYERGNIFNNMLDRMSTSLAKITNKYKDWKRETIMKKDKKISFLVN